MAQNEYNINEIYMIDPNFDQPNLLLPACPNAPLIKQKAHCSSPKKKEFLEEEIDTGPLHLLLKKGKKAIGTILSQKDNQGKEKVISYASRTLMARFTLITDHSALKYLFGQKLPKGQLAHWILILQEYDFDIQYYSESNIPMQIVFLVSSLTLLNQPNYLFFDYQLSP
ncbi:45142_t:CDS:2 [Gigaspora margarita]|uniref:45142_t:CDS:1 n=1 Tax=Gigaspora margarita TaxID=4874 RepID=A0ABN7UUQ8_GIGMA|nr:45142_t:CDS:2 [Gigaspora margarita]